MNCLTKLTTTDNCTDLCTGSMITQFLCPRPERSATASSVWIVCPSVRLSVRLSVHNSVPLTNKVQYLKFGWSYSNQTWTVSSSKGCSHFTDITCPWGWSGVKMYDLEIFAIVWICCRRGHPCFTNTCLVFIIFEGRTGGRLSPLPTHCLPPNSGSRFLHAIFFYPPSPFLSPLSPPHFSLPPAQPLLSAPLSSVPLPYPVHPFIFDNDIVWFIKRGHIYPKRMQSCVCWKLTTC